MLINLLKPFPNETLYRKTLKLCANFLFLCKYLLRGKQPKSTPEKNPFSYKKWKEHFHRLVKEQNLTLNSKYESAIKNCGI